MKRKPRRQYRRKQNNWKSVEAVSIRNNSTILHILYYISFRDTSVHIWTTVTRRPKRQTADDMSRSGRRTSSPSNFEGAEAPRRRLRPLNRIQTSLTGARRLARQTERHARTQPTATTATCTLRPCANFRRFRPNIDVSVLSNIFD